LRPCGFLSPHRRGRATSSLCQAALVWGRPKERRRRIQKAVLVGWSREGRGPGNDGSQEESKERPPTPRAGLAGGPDWSISPLPDSQSLLEGVDCVSVQECVAAGWPLGEFDRYTLGSPLATLVEPGPMVTSCHHQGHAGGWESDYLCTTNRFDCSARGKSFKALSVVVNGK
jgi:hypothetical protein